MDSKKLALRCRELAEERKAEDVLVLDVRKQSSITDFFVIASGTSEPHLRAIVEEISDTLKEENGLAPRAMDGSVQTSWIVLDYFDVIVHVMRKDARETFDLEGLWGDAPRVSARKATLAAAKKDGAKDGAGKSGMKRAKKESGSRKSSGAG